MIIKSYNELPDEAKYIRTAVFVEEQGFKEEFDTDDSISTHIVLFDDNKPVATGRFYFNIEKQEYMIGRLAVIKEYRGKGLGSEIVKEAEKLIKSEGGKAVSLHSQCRAQSFYENLGYTAFGESDFDEDCPHQWMKKEL
ncbi:MAG: GNAT family N-acetyltransferase [Acetobacter sp.]|nr:GNAT family N-acetyltransferase [Bacteroides sp.]MCM1341762.1 GNAT family N-acetyltransferase [Acetobacter sp.]MCM1433105.1 GNAT family N-acetyltransferase [Clostridiales bacterium]